MGLCAGCPCSSMATTRPGRCGQSVFSPSCSLGIALVLTCTGLSETTAFLWLSLPGCPQSLPADEGTTCSSFWALQPTFCITISANLLRAIGNSVVPLISGYYRLILNVILDLVCVRNALTGV